jgi:hypothetical protein
MNKTLLPTNKNSNDTPQGSLPSSKRSKTPHSNSLTLKDSAGTVKHST